jgi:hypothetical protein
VIFDEIDEGLLRFIISLVDVYQLLIIELVVVIQMKNLLGKQRIFRSIEVLLTVVELGGNFIVS